MNWRTICRKVVKQHMINLTPVKLSYSDIILKDFIKKDIKAFEKSHRLKVLQMKVGIIWQTLLGHVKNVEDLGVGHSSALDLLYNKDGQKYIIELKNSLKTDNSSAKMRNMQKLHAFVKDNTEYTPVYGIINCKSGPGQDKIVEYSGMRIRMLTGRKLLDFLLEEEYDIVIKSFKAAIAPFMKKLSKHDF